jgi:hypothetical protein
MKPRFYVVFVQHNKEADAENRTVPSAFDNLKDAYQKYYEQLGKDMKNATLDWSVGCILDNFGNKIESKYWSDITEEPEVTEPVETTEE